MKTLIQLQDECLERMHEPRTSAKRAAKNRTAALTKLRSTLVKRCYTDVDVIINDVKDMYKLEVNSEEA